MSTSQKLQLIFCVLLWPFVSSCDVQGPTRTIAGKPTIDTLSYHDFLDSVAENQYTMHQLQQEARLRDSVLSNLKNDTLSEIDRKIFSHLEDSVFLGLFLRYQAEFIYTVYGKDDRLDWYELKKDKAKKEAFNNSQAVGLLFPNKQKLKEYRDTYLELEAQLLKYNPGKKLCGGFQFKHQRVPPLGICTCFLIGPNLIATAGHCLEKKKSTEAEILLDCYASESCDKMEQIRTNPIYSIDSCLFFRDDKLVDLAIYRLAEKVDSHQILTLDFSMPATLQALYAWGHPYGLPLKFVDGSILAKVEDNKCQTQLDMSAGNSGSPIFAQSTNQVIGVFVAGSRDYNENCGKMPDSCIFESKGCLDFETFQSFYSVKNEIEKLIRETAENPNPKE